MKHDHGKSTAEVLPKFTKQQLLASERYGHSRDILSVLLQDGISYAQKETEQLIDDFRKRKVN